MAFVVDASMALSWHFPDEETAATAALFDRTVTEPIVVPGHWQAELANGALVGERRGRTNSAQTSSFVGRLAIMMIEVDRHGADCALDIVLPLARAHRLTIYDAIYLELAERRGLPLATLGVELAAAARSIGVQVLGKAEEQ